MRVKNQHGDVLLVEVAEIPAGAKRVEIRPGFILERGEGVHTHVFPNVEGIEVYEKDGDTYVRVTKPTEIDHEEHGKEPVLPGVYKKRIERCFDYEKNEERKVID